MTNFIAADVKKLHELTGSDMEACKDALVETDDDFDKTVEILRTKGTRDTSKRAERIVAEGLITVSDNTMVKVNFETDFVAKNRESIDFANKVADAVAAVRANFPEEPITANFGGQTVADAVQELSTKIGEKLELRRVATLEGDSIAIYLHRRAADLPAVVGILVAYTGKGEGAAEVAHIAAMQAATLKVQYLLCENVPADRVEAERVVYEKITREEGKPEQAIAKIVEGRLNGSHKDVVLLEQSSVADNKKTAKQLMDEAGVTPIGFVRFEVGQH